MSGCTLRAWRATEDWAVKEDVSYTISWFYRGGGTAGAFEGSSGIKKGNVPED